MCIRDRRVRALACACVHVRVRVRVRVPVRARVRVRAGVRAVCEHVCCESAPPPRVRMLSGCLRVCVPARLCAFMLTRLR
eukprot:6586311-Alexandrium_andersonii.AAC.1